MRSSHAGRTLIEMAVALSMVALVANAALPALAGLLARQSLVSAQHLLHGHLHLARHQAIVGAKPVVVCPLTGGRCSGEAGDWSQGWVVFQDPDGLNHCTPDTAQQHCLEHSHDILAVSTGSKSVAIVANRNVARRVRFNSQGMSYGYTGRFTFCHPSATVGALGLVVPQTGRIRRATPEELLPCTF